jgi:RNA-directed DNA polymerase
MQIPEAPAGTRVGVDPFTKRIKFFRDTRPGNNPTQGKQAGVEDKPKRANQTLNLDASQFAPKTGAEIKSELGGRGQWSFEIFRREGLVWGRRDIIPASNDPRTRLVDQGMVGQGLVTAQELVEIHTVGDEMLRIRPELDNAHLVAQEAVERSVREKEEIKAQKKAEAEARKKAHAEGVAHRKANDIVFLGRGVSRLLGDRRANVEKLSAAGLPVLATPKDLADAMGLTIKELRWLAFHAEATTRPHYVRFTVAKKSGGTRELAAPHAGMAKAQDWVLANVLEKVQAHGAAHGFVKGRNTVTNATAHLHASVLINCDLKDFFPTITVHRVIGVFAEMGFSPAVATLLALICTEAPRMVVEYAGVPMHVATGPRALPQGASTSPAISNLVARRMDSRLTGICKKMGFVYTRYADDLSLSAKGPGAEAGVGEDDPTHPGQMVGYMLARVRHIARDEGFAVNEKKTRVQRASHSQRVTGVVVNGDVPAVPRVTLRKLRAILHQAQKTGLAAQNRHGHPYFEGYVRGMIAYVHMVNPKQAAPLREALRKCGR